MFYFLDTIFKSIYKSIYFNLFYSYFINDIKKHLLYLFKFLYFIYKLILGLFF